MRKNLRYILYGILAFIISLLVLPFAFRDNLIDAVKQRVNEEINAQVDFETVQISLIRQFPNVSLDIYLLKINGIDDFEGIRLFASDKVSIKTDWKSLLNPSKGITVKQLRLEAPELNLIVRSDSINNYSIIKQSGESSDNFFGKINQYSISKGTLSYIDQENSISIYMDSVYHEGNGDFDNNRFDLATSTNIPKFDMTYQGIPFLKSAQVKASMLIDIDIENSKYSFKENSMSLNALEFSLNGSMESIGDSWGVDLSFESKNNAVSSILSLIPEMYSSDFENIQTQGSGHIEAVSLGLYNPDKGVFPSLDLDIVLKNGFVQYPDLPFPLEGIQSHLVIKAEEGNWSDLIIELSQFDFFLNGKPFGSKFKVSELLNDPHITANILGSIDMKSLSGFLPKENHFISTGLIDAGISLDAYRSDIINKNYPAIDFNGSLNATNLSWNQNGMDSRLTSFNTTFSPSVISSDIEGFYIGNSQIDGSLALNDPLALLSNPGLSEFNFIFNSSVIDLDEAKRLMNQAEEKESEIEPIAVIPKWSLKFTGEQIIYNSYEISDLKLIADYDKELLSISQASVTVNKDPIQLKGEISNILSYLDNQDTLKARLFLDANSFKFNSYSGTEDNASVSQNIIIPPNVSVQLDANINKLKYNELTFEDFGAHLEIKDAVMDLTNVQAGLLGGRAVFGGQYDCKDPQRPIFNFRYDLANLSFKKLFVSSELFRTLAPFTEYIDGKFNSSLVISGPLGDQMKPLLNEIDASGFIETFGAQFSDLPLIAGITKKLGLSGIQEWYIKDSRNWFEIKDGRIDLKKREYQISDISFSVAGAYDLNHELDLSVLASIPRDKLGSSSINNTIDTGIAFLQREAGKLGVDIQNGTHVYLDIGVKGKINDAKITVKPAGSGGNSIKPEVQNQIEKGKEILKDTINSHIQDEKERIKDSLSVKKDQLKDTVVNKAESVIDSLKDKTGQLILEKIDSNLLKTKIDSNLIKGKDVGDLLEKAKQTEIDSIKSKLNNWNPFKKKKKK